MRDDELAALFDQGAAHYDTQWVRMAPIREALHFLLESVFADLPADARVLVVGAGTGAELVHLATRFPGWTFTAVDLSGAMLDACRRKAESAGFAARCRFVQGRVDALAVDDSYDAATAFLVSQFILDDAARSAFFRAIAQRLKPGGILASSDLSADVASGEYDALLHAWLAMMARAGIPAEGLERMRATYAKDVAILPPARVASIIEAGGYDAPVPFYRAGLIEAWFAYRTR